VYTLRVNISVAATKMKDDLNWSEDDKGYVLSSFYWGYAAGQIPAVLIAKRYGAREMFGCSVLITSILTIFVPVAANTSLGLFLTYYIIMSLSDSHIYISQCIYSPSLLLM